MHTHKHTATAISASVGIRAAAFYGPSDQHQSKGRKGRQERSEEEEKSLSRSGVVGVGAKDGRKGGRQGKNTCYTEGVDNGGRGSRVLAAGSGGGGGVGYTVFSGPSEASLSLHAGAIRDWEFRPP